jgi:NAD(P)-dependent dehydrogenase (short-subunit alcohol dehydrogenase family)
MQRKSVILTGSEGQIGSALWIELESKDYKVIPVDLGDCDLRDMKAVEDLYRNLFKKNDNICGLINCAGVSLFTDSMVRTEDEFDYVVDTNLKGTFNSIKAFVNRCKDESSIVTISSIYGIVSPDFSIYGEGDRKSPEVYGASKAGLIQMTRYFAVYLANRKIRVNCVSPGGILANQDSEFVRRYSERCPMNRMGRSEEVAKGVSFLLGNEASYINGHNLVIDGGLTCW